MNRIVFALCMVLLISCGTKKADNKGEEKKLNPNGDSELAVLMRTMHEHAKLLKEEILAGKSLTTYPEEIKTINTAEPTPGMIANKEVFDGFAGLYLSKLDSIYLTDVNIKLQYNHMVNSCVDCHQVHCQGPLPAIRKLYIPIN
ncbi:MAG: hypothetical protein N2167_05850 [Flavobacteriales bacterium]|nr:hypothetical protein [Flavobacteriales bacterium]